MRRLVIVCALWGAAWVSLAQGIIPMKGQGNQFGALPDAAQRYYVMGYNEGLYSMGLALQEWLAWNTKTLTLAQRNTLLTLSRVGIYANNQLDTEDMRFILTYAGNDDQWELDVVRQLIDELVAYMRRHPNGE